MLTVKGVNAAEVFKELYRWTCRAIPGVRHAFRSIPLQVVEDLEEQEEEAAEAPPPPPPVPEEAEVTPLSQQVACV